MHFYFTAVSLLQHKPLFVARRAEPMHARTHTHTHTHTLILISGSLRPCKDRRYPLLPRKRPRCLGSGCVVVHPMILCDSMNKSDQSVEQLHRSRYSSWGGDTDILSWCETGFYLHRFFCIIQYISLFFRANLCFKILDVVRNNQTLSEG